MLKCIAALLSYVYAGLRVPQMDFDEFRSRDEQLNRFMADPTSACFATLFKAGGIQLDSRDLSDAHDALQHCQQENDIVSAEGVQEFYTYLRAIITEVSGSEDAAETVVKRMRKLLLSCADNAEESWRSGSMLWLGAVCACGGPVYTLDAMDCVLVHVAEALQEHTSGDTVPLNMEQLQDCYSALQEVGSEVVPSLTAVA
jgi:hypothetical protein